MARRVLDVFLSSTAEDLTAYRDALHARLIGIEFFRCVRQEDFRAQDAGATDYCRQAVEKADLFVGLIGMRRGWEPDGDNAKRSITEMEHDWARDAGRKRYLWVTPENFPVPGNLREPAAKHKRQLAFRKRVMAGGERIVSQKGFGSPELLASEIVEHLLAQVVTSDLIKELRPELGAQGAVEEQAPAIAAAVEKLASDRDVDLLALAKDPKGVDVAELEAKLRARAEAHEAHGQRERKASAEYWRHIGALSFLRDTKKALAAYAKAVALDPDEPEGWRFLGELRYRAGELTTAEATFESLLRLAQQRSDKRAESMALLRQGWIHRDRSNLAVAEGLQAEALRLANAAGWMEGVARAYANLGLIHWLRGDLPKAEETQLKSLRLGEELGSKEGMARAYGNLGIIHRARGELAKAEDMQLKSLKLSEELGSKEGMALACGNLGVIHWMRGSLAKAEEMQLEALKLNEELGSKEGMARAYRNLGSIYDQKGNKLRMCECWRTARDHYRQMGLADKAAEVERRLRLKGCGDA